jgi:hypothetical protein
MTIDLNLKAYEIQQHEICVEIMNTLQEVCQACGHVASISEVFFSLLRLGFLILFAKIIGSFLNNTLQSHDHIFHIPLGVMIQFNMTYYQAYHHPATLDTFSRILTSYSPGKGIAQEPYNTMLRRMVASVCESTATSLIDASYFESRPDQIFSFFKLLNQVCHDVLPTDLFSNDDDVKALVTFPLCFYEMPENVLDGVMQLMLYGLGVDQRLSLKAILQFLVKMLMFAILRTNSSLVAIDLSRWG